MTESYTVDGRLCSGCGRRISYYEQHICQAGVTYYSANPFPPPSISQVLTELRELRKLVEEIGNKLRQ